MSGSCRRTASAASALLPNTDAGPQQQRPPPPYEAVQRLRRNDADYGATIVQEDDSWEDCKEEPDEEDVFPADAKVDDLSEYDGAAAAAAGGSTAQQQLYASPDAPLAPSYGASPSTAAHPHSEDTPWPDDLSLPVQTVYGFAVNPVCMRRYNARLDSIHVTDPTGAILFHFRWSLAMKRKKTHLKPSFCLLVRGPQAERNKVKGIDLPWEKGPAEIQDWLWKYDTKTCYFESSGSHDGGGAPTITRFGAWCRSGLPDDVSATQAPERSWCEFDSGDGRRVRWVCSSFLSWSGMKRWDEEEFRLHDVSAGTGSSGSGSGSGSGSASNQVLARFVFRPTHALTFSDTSLDQTCAIFALGYLIRRNWGVMYECLVVEGCRSGFDRDQLAWFFNRNILRQYADEVLGA